MMKSFSVLLLICLTVVNSMNQDNNKRAKLRPTVVSTTNKSDKSNLVYLDFSDDDTVEATEDEDKEADVAPEDDSASENEEGDETSEESDLEEAEYYSEKRDDVRKAWNAAGKLPNRDPSVWRVDKQGNIILARHLTMSSPLSFKALVKRDDEGSLLGFEAIQGEYFGMGDEDNHANALKYRAKDREQDDLLSLIEIALNGNVGDQYEESYCWCPSLIHQDLFMRDHEARRWHAKLFDYGFKYGMAGHNLAFQHMNVGVKDVRHYSEKTLDTLDQVNDFMFIKDFQPECSAVVDAVEFKEDAVQRATDIKNNWGLPRVAEFLDPAALKKAKTVVKKITPVAPTRTTGNSVMKMRNPQAASHVPNFLDQDQFPSLSQTDDDKKKKTTGSVAAPAAVVSKPKITQSRASAAAVVNVNDDSQFPSLGSSGAAPGKQTATKMALKTSKKSIEI